MNANTLFAVRLLLALVPASLAAGCSSSPPDTEDTARSSEALTPGPGPRIQRVNPGVAAAGATAAAPVATGCTQALDTLRPGLVGVFPLPAGATSATIAPVHWGAGVNASNDGAIAGLAEALGASASGIVFFGGPTFEPEPYMSWLQSEYGIPPVAEISPPITITPLVCNTTSSCTVTDAQIQQELARQVGVTLELGSALLYVLEFPPNITITTPGPMGTILPSCVKFCAFHSSFSVGGTLLQYIVLPDFLSTACGSICGNWPTSLGQMSSALSHEVIETLTDPNPFTGWSSADPKCQEIGDICNGEQVQIDNAGYTAVVQKQWSNMVQSCVATTTGPSITTITPSTGLGTLSTPVTVTGTGFTSPMTFLFGSLPATGVSCPSTTLCTMSAPLLNGFGSPTRTVVVTAVDPTGFSSVQEPTATNFKYGCVSSACPASSCGSEPDGCGGTLSCSCAAGQTCVGGSCCTPATCARTCGTQSDGCGGTLTCGAPCACLTPAQACGSALCGTAADGCGHMLSCGVCPSGRTCAAGSCIPHCTPPQCCVEQGGVWVLGRCILQ